MFAELLARLARGLDAAGLTEDLVVHKVLAGRPRDLEDVRGVLRKNPRIDATSVRTALRDIGQAVGEPLQERFEALVAETHGRR